MRLTAIKLAGFKSFVDPTVLRLGSNLTGVVGPNGCGKSNVIDAVRWVTGESSAKQLRGEALEDVIFNGSKARKPVGRASIELLFDNSAGKLGGQYAQFAEISIRRELSRDGNSQYWINGARCRRRDVIDLFLGTGLGGRSNYAVIEQGAVNRLVEAKPEDMRQVLEEAAGISRYKEKRRETENRIRHTRDNLDRLNDVISEVTQRLAQLQRQAANAEKFKQYKQEERQLRAELLALRWQSLEAESSRQNDELRARVEKLEQARNQSRDIADQRETQRRDQQAAAHECQRLQGDFYTAEAELARVEQALAHARELRRVREQELEDAKRSEVGLEQRMAEENSATENWTRQLGSREESEDVLARETQAAQVELEAAEKQAVEVESRWDSLNQSDNNPVQRAETERARAEQLEQNLNGLGKRLERQLAEWQRLESEPLQQSLAEAESTLSRLGEELDALHADHESAESELRSLRQTRGEQEQALRELRQVLATQKGQLTSEEALQQAALREDDKDLSAWLEQQGWDAGRRVAHQVQVESGWEMAAEAALGGFLRAVALPDLQDRIGRVEQWPGQALTLVADTHGDVNSPAEGPAGAPSLASVMQAPAALSRLAGRIFLVNDDRQAREAVPRLAADQMLVTREGVCYGAGWVRVPRGKDPQGGVIRREQTISELREQCRSMAADENDRQTGLDNLQARLQEAEQKRAGYARALDDLRKRHGQQLAERQGIQVRLDQTQRRRRELDEDIKELREQQRDYETRLTQSREQLDEVAGAARDHVQQRQQAQENLRQQREALGAARRKLEGLKNRRQNLQLELANLNNSKSASAQRAAELQERLTRQRERVARMQADFATLPAEDADTESRSDIAQRREAARAALEQARKQLGEIEGRADEIAQRALTAEQAVEGLRETVQQARVELENVAVRRQTLEEQLAEAGHSPQAVCETLDEAANASQWEQKLEALERRIQRLGAINLAAIEEFETEKEREEYLQTQHTDLSEALATLEAAIAKIDRETRSRFRDTYERVNHRFSDLFPTLFGGGEARLELTEDDMLETGIRVMARPPGKRNASIQMLSGGEKALTAVALLFALFELNPAPFCMLDEIDAPLDDANVVRFCELVKRMAEHVQFIVITHNKVTMEMAQQLHGVTMQEPGVSRLVSVDVDEAMKMAS
ncbi:MAG: chromosome segregation protein SMC [Salinisphaeraceae bacterium]|nr:chromosome segregation protein SMC [Salinisphaeraceae bacterium]